MTIKAIIITGIKINPTKAIISPRNIPMIVKRPKQITAPRITAPTNRETKFIIQTFSRSSSAILVVSTSSRFQGKINVLSKRSIEKKAKAFKVNFFAI